MNQESRPPEGRSEDSSVYVYMYMENTHTSLYTGLCGGKSIYAHMRVQPNPTRGKCRYAHLKQLMYQTSFGEKDKQEIIEREAKL